MLITCGSSDDVLARLVVTGLNLERCVAVREYERGAGGPRDDEDEHPHRSSDKQAAAGRTHGGEHRASVRVPHALPLPVPAPEVVTARRPNDA
jgi:hypothetical protein